MPGYRGGTPGTVTLMQNYPNPFNGTTTIRFSLASQAFVSLKVYDVLGREVSTLVQETLEGGEHARQWDAPAASSGTYYCRFHTPSGSRTIRIVVLR
ncbi:MAG: T9SS type A sorting domain-containing protein [Ignavibacteriae bacterium]|nr:T9SS type A sorting domain-containing protein [Ignavibacteriota bacterium]